MLSLNQRRDVEEGATEIARCVSATDAAGWLAAACLPYIHIYIMSQWSLGSALADDDVV